MITEQIAAPAAAYAQPDQDQIVFGVINDGAQIRLEWHCTQCHTTETAEAGLSGRQYREISQRFVADHTDCEPADEFADLMNDVYNGLPPGDRTDQMAAYTQVYIRPVATNEQSDGSTTCEVATPAEADFWSVYGRLTDGTSEAVCDQPSRPAVLLAASFLAMAHNMDVQECVYCHGAAVTELLIDTSPHTGRTTTELRPVCLRCHAEAKELTR